MPKKLTATLPVVKSLKDVDVYHVVQGNVDYRTSFTALRVALTGGAISDVEETGLLAVSCEAIYDNFDDHYLGEKTSDPRLDNDGNPLKLGTIFFNSTDRQLKVFDNYVWRHVYSTVIVVNDTFTGNGSTTDFTLSTSTTDSSTIVFVNGEVIGENEYSVIDTTLSFTSPPANSAHIVVKSYVESSLYNDAASYKFDTSNSSIVATNLQDAIEEVKADADLLGGGGGSGGVSYTTGQMLTYGGQNTPTGFLDTNGQAVSKTTYSNLYSVIGDAYRIQGVGTPASSQFLFNQSQTDIPVFDTTHAFTISNAGARFVSFKNYIYGIGGSSTTCYKCPIVNGLATGFVTTTPFPTTAKTNPCLIAGKNYIYSVCGTSSNVVRYASTNGNGDLVWSSNVITFPKSGTGTSGFELDGYLYAGTNDGTSTWLYKGFIEPDGNILSWEFVMNSYFEQSAFCGNYIYQSAGVNVYQYKVLNGVISLNKTLTLPASGAWPCFSTKNRLFIPITTGGMYAFNLDESGDAIGSAYSVATNISVTGAATYSFHITSQRIYRCVVTTTNIGLVQSAPFTGGFDDYTNYYDYGVPNSNEFNLPAVGTSDGFKHIIKT